MTKTHPRFSIVTITYDDEVGLLKTAHSIKRQSCGDYEWIVIDGTSNLILPESIPPQKITFISEPDEGIYDAMNKGINHANGDYIIFMNAGDIFENKNILSIIAKLNADFIYGDSLEEDGIHPHYKKARSANRIELGMFTHHQAMVYKTALIENLRYNEDYKISADYDFTFRFLKNVKTVKYIEHPICVFESGGISQMKVQQARIEQFKIRQKMGFFILKNIFIFLAQTILYRIRKLCPKIYWLLKHSPLAGNI